MGQGPPSSSRTSSKFKLLQMQRPYLPMRSHPEVVGARTSPYEFAAEPITLRKPEPWSPPAADRHTSHCDQVLPSEGLSPGSCGPAHKCWSAPEASSKPTAAVGRPSRFRGQREQGWGLGQSLHLADSWREEPAAPTGRCLERKARPPLGLRESVAHARARGGGSWQLEGSLGRKDVNGM